MHKEQQESKNKQSGLIKTEEAKFQTQTQQERLATLTTDT